MNAFRVLMTYNPANFFKSRIFFLSLVSFIVLVAVAFFVIGRIKPQVKSASTSGVPFQTDKPIVAFASRKVCSLLGVSQMNVGIYGQDGGVGTHFGGKSYFMFGDITGSLGQWILPNSVSYTTDTSASGCQNLVSKSSGGIAQPLFAKLPALGEITVWPVSWVDGNITPGFIYFYYASIDSTIMSQGVGLAKMNTSDLSTQRLGACSTISNCFLWNNNTLYSTYGIRLMGAQATLSGSDLYVFVSIEGSGGQIGIGLMKVALSAVANNNIADYQYWNGTSFVSDFSQVAPIWRVGTGLLWLNNVSPFTYAHGVSVRYNNFLGKWVATYNTGILSVVAGRVADNLVGPWSSEAVLVKCDQWVSGATGFFCYGGAQHPQFSSGPILYETYSNGTEYQVYMQEIILGSALYQWSDSQGNTVYLQSSTVGPSGYTLDGNVFTVSSVPAYDLVPIYDWFDASSGIHLYETSSPGASYSSQGVAFYAKNYQDTKNTLIAVYRWQTAAGKYVYSTFDLSPLGYTRAATPSYYVQGETGAATPPPPTSTPTPPGPSPTPTPPPIAGDPSNLTAVASCNGSVPVITFNWQDNSNYESGFWLDVSRDPFNGPSNTSTKPSVWGVKGVYRSSADSTATGNTVQFAWDNGALSLTKGVLDSGDSDSNAGGNQLTPQAGSTYFWRVKAFNFTQATNHIYPGSAASPPGQSVTAVSCP